MANNYTEEARALIDNLINTIKNDYSRFLDYLDKNGQYQFYNKQRSFIQRLMFFESYGNYENYRNMIKKFIFDVDYPYPYLRYRKYDEQDAERMRSVIKAFHEKCWFYTPNYINNLITDMIAFKNKLLEDNPILAGNLPLEVRENLINTILRNSPDYQEAKKTIDKYINKMVAQIITSEKDEADRVSR